MKKNLISVVILALVFVNLVLTGILAFTIIPETKNANALIAKVASAIDLELSAGNTSDSNTVPMEDIATYDVAADDSKMTINLKDDADGTKHYAVLSITLSMNTKSDGYKTYSATLDSKKNLIKNEINNVISNHTMQEMQDSTQDIQDEITENLQSMFGSDFIIGVSFGDVVYQ